MAIDTNTKKLALLEWDLVFEPGLPLSPGTIGADDQQQLLWGYPGILWEAGAPVTGTIITTLARTRCLATGTVDADAEVELPVGTRITEILVRARDTLADPNKNRWSDERLLRLLDEGQKDIAKQSKILKDIYDLTVAVDTSNYTLPDNFWLITRATFDDYEIPLVSYDLMDENARKQVLADRRTNEHERRNGYGNNLGDRWTRTNWEVDTASRIEAIVYDKRNINDIRVYPIPNDGIAENNYTFENEGPIIFAGDEVMGIVTSIDDYTIDSVFGVTTELYDPAIAAESFDSDFGVLTGANESVALVKLWYIKIPEVLLTLSQDLEIPPMFDVALKHYVIGHALRDDIDVQYREMGAESLALYERELVIAQETNRTDGTRNAVNHTPTYRSGFE